MVLYFYNQHRKECLTTQNGFIAGSISPVGADYFVMTNISVLEQNGNLVVDSRIVADQLGVNHSDWFRNIIKKYETQIEKGFGVIRFENGKPESNSKGGRPEKFAWLTEDQCLFVMTLSRNTDQVIECKINLVKAFAEARKQLTYQPARQTLGAYTQRVEAMFDDANKIPNGYWCVLHESANLLIWVETKLKYPIDKVDLLDGSIGSHWSNYRKDKSWTGDRVKFSYRFPDGRYCNPWCYQMKELEYFRYFLEDKYRPVLLPRYLESKYPALVNI